MTAGGLQVEAGRYERTGYCRTGCGACCMSIHLQVPPDYLSDQDVRHWIELHGLAIFSAGGATFVKIPNRCSALTEDSRCGLYGTLERPKLCAAFPSTPAALATLEDICSYSWQER